LKWFVLLVRSGREGLSLGHLVIGIWWVS